MPSVPPTGPRNSPLLALVGEAPGADEERLGKPFVGPSGFLLDQMLSAAGINRDSCYITNVVKVRPPNNLFAKTYYEDGKYGYPTMALLNAREALWAELREVKPKVVVALGAEALKALTPHQSIVSYRGTMVEHFGLRVIPTLHPAYLLRGQYHERPIVEADLRKALRQARFPSKPVTNFNIDPTFEEVMFFLRQRHARLATDIETVENTTRMIGFAWNKHDAICIQLMQGRSHKWTLEQEIEILRGLDALFRDFATEKVLQNLMYDCTVLAREFGFVLNNVTLDTMLAHHVLFPELPKGLDFLSSIYTDHPMYWGYNSKSQTETAQYNCMDCVVTEESAQEIELELHKRQSREFYDNVIHRAVLALLFVQSRGVRIDLAERQRIDDATVAEMVQIKQSLADSLGFELNPGSPKQVSELVYRKWGLPVQTHPKTKKPTTDDDALQMLAKKHVKYAPVLKKILEHRQKKVLLSTFVRMKLRDDRVFTSYNVAGTVTGRLSSSATIDGIGGNLQNIPRGSFRRIFIADPGKVIIKADLSQAEYRVLIWKARIHRVIARWQTEPGFNIHMWNASENIFRVPIGQVTKDQYSKAKNGVYGANYSIGAMKVSKMYNMEYKESKFILERYHEAVPEIKDVFQKEIVEEVVRTRELTNPLGRRRVFFGRMDDDTFRAAYSHYCQSTVADLINLALIELHEVELSSVGRDIGLDVLLQVHDELVCQCNEDCVPQAVGLIRQAMERPILLPKNDVPLTIPCEIKVGRNWYDTMTPEKWVEGLLNKDSKESVDGTPVHSV